MRASVGQSDPSHSVDWCDDPPQEVRVFSKDFLRHVSGGRYHPLPPSQKSLDGFQKSIHRAFILSCIHP